MSTSGVLLVRTKENVECCLVYSITTLEDGSSPKSPVVKNGNCNRHLFVFNFQLTFQEYVDNVVQAQDGRGLCVEGWQYVVEGNVIEAYIYTHICMYILLIYYHIIVFIDF